jgi:hypothetical protein
MVDGANKSLAKLEHARGAFLQAENDYIVAKRTFLVSQEKHDISMGHILDMFQDKEMKKRSEVKKVFQRIVKLLQTYEQNMAKQINDVIAKTRNLNLEQDLAEFCTTCYTDETPPHVRINHPKDGESKDYFKVDLALNICEINSSMELRQSCFDRCEELLRQGQYYVKLTLQYHEERFGLDEGICKALRKGTWNITTAWPCSMSKAFSSWNRLMLGQATAGEKMMQENKEKVHIPLKTLLDHLKSSHSNIAKQYEKLLTDVKPIYAVHEKAAADCTKAHQALDSARDKLKKSAEKERKSVEPDNARRTTMWGLPTLGKPDNEKLQAKVTAAEAELKQAEIDLNKTTLLLAKTKEMEIKRFVGILTAIKELEQHRIDQLREICKAWTEIHQYALHFVCFLNLPSPQTLLPGVYGFNRRSSRTYRKYQS